MADDVCVVTNVSTQTHKSKIGCERIRRSSENQPGTQMCLNNTSSAVYTASPRDQHCPGDRGYSVRMQQEHFGKYSVLEQGKSWADRQALTSLTAQSLSRLLIPPDTNSRLCFTFTSICREGREGGSRNSKPYQISHFFYLPFSYKLSLSWPLLCVCLSPSHSFSLFLPLSLSPPFPTSLLSLSVILFWGSAETSSPLQPYSLLTLHLKFICKHGPV